MTSTCREHYDALKYALSLGCNVIDTSANYMNGASENLIGMVLKEHPTYDPFIITKAGYIQDDNLMVIAKLNEGGRAKNGLIAISNDCKYSIHPDFLENQLELSRGRLNREWIDGFLLHNPEYYFDQDTQQVSTAEYYVRIRKAFEVLEDMVSEGRIRYYGVSSNTFPFGIDKPSTTNLHKLITLAKQVSERNHFRLIQFPFNFLETGAIKPHHDGVSLVELARANGIVTLSNRPLNAKTEAGTLRLASYEAETQQLEENRDRQIFHDCLELVNQQLVKLEVPGDAMDFMVINLLNENWMRLSSPEAVAQVFQDHFYPFLEHLYQGKVPDDDMTNYRKLYQFANLYAKKTMTQSALTFRRKMITTGVIRSDDQRPLPVIACESYLKSGIDHVLMGMRSVKYVESVKALF